MDKQAEIVAFAKLLGSQLSTREILDKYQKYYQETIRELKDNLPPSTMEIGDKKQLFNR